MKALLGAFNQEKALVGAFSVITNLRMELLRHYPGHRAAGLEVPEHLRRAHVAARVAHAVGVAVADPEVIWPRRTSSQRSQINLHTYPILCCPEQLQRGRGNKSAAAGSSSSDLDRVSRLSNNEDD